MNKYKIQFSKDAKKDLIDIYKYIKYSLQESTIANKLVKKIKEEVYKLKDNPTIYATIKDEFIKKREIRKIKIDNYIVFYKTEEKNNMIQIVRIMYERRNWTKIL